MLKEKLNNLIKKIDLELNELEKIVEKEEDANKIIEFRIKQKELLLRKLQICNENMNISSYV